MRKIVFNIDDFCDRDWPIMDHLFALKKRYPNFKVTLFTIPFKISREHLLEAKSTGWIELAVHGFTHIPKEMLVLNREEIVKGFSTIDFSLFTRGFRAPYWLLNEEVIECCNLFKMWVALHHTKNDGSWKNLCQHGYYYPRDTENLECWYAHTYDIKNELAGLLKKWEPDREFAFVSEAIQKIIKLNFGIGYHPIAGFINLEFNLEYIERSRSEDCDVRECDLRDGLGMFNDGSADAATISHTLMYLKDEEYLKFLTEVYRVLRAGGVFRVTEDNCEHPNCGEHRLPWPDKISVTGPKMMRVELKKAGFEVHDVGPDETLWADKSLIQRFHGDPPRVFHMEGVKK